MPGSTGTPPALVYVDLKVGETVAIGAARVTLAAKSGQRARLAVCVDRTLPVARLGRASPISPGAQECASSTCEGASCGELSV